MANIETAAQRQANGKELIMKMATHCRRAYNTLNKERKEICLNLFDQLGEKIETYWNHEEVWDSKPIDVVISVGDIKCKSIAISTFDSVMDKARELYCAMTPPARGMK